MATKTIKSSPLDGVSFDRMIGITLGGPRSDRTAISILEFYPRVQKLILSRLFYYLKGDEQGSADKKVLSVIADNQKALRWIAFDVPLSSPTCFTCELKCPGSEVCKVPELVWMRKHLIQKELGLPAASPFKIESSKRISDLSPYTRRCADLYWSSELYGPWSLSEALGSNLAPLTARARYLKRQIKHPTLECVPRLSLSRWSQHYFGSMMHMRNYRHPVNGAESREYLLLQFSEKLNLFIYEQDRQILIEHLSAFESLLSALTAFWKLQGRCELPPKGYPRRSGGWIEVPLF